MMFGTSGSAPSSFGQTSGGFSFGAQQAATSAGTQPPAAPGQFSFGQSGTSTTGGFGTTPTTSFGQGSSSLFGQAAPAPASGLFGGGTSSFQQPTSLAGSSGGLGFSQPQLQQQQPSSLFAGAGTSSGILGGSLGAGRSTGLSILGGGQPFGGGGQYQYQMQPGKLTAPGIPRPAGFGIERRFHELWSEIAEYLGDGRLNPDARCVTLCYDTHDKPYPAKPECVHDDLWKRYIRENPDPEKLSPALVIGMDGLKRRIEMAQQYCLIFQEDTNKINQRAQLLLRSSQVNEAQLTELKARSSKLVLRFLRVAKKIELLRAQHLPVHLEERRLYAKLRSLDSQLATPATRLEALALKAKRINSTSSNSHDNHSTVSSSKANTQLLAALDLQTNGLRHLLTVSNTDHRDLKIMSSDIRKLRSNTF